MTSNRTFGQDLSAWLRDEAAGRVPDHLEAVLVQTTATRQRPWWSSPRRWLAMDFPVPRSLGSRSTRLLLFVTAVLVVAALIAVAVGGGRPSLPNPLFAVESARPSAPPSGGPPNPSDGPSQALPSVAPSEHPSNSSASGSWSVTGSTPRGHTFGSAATLLRDGRVLVVGGEVGNEYDGSAKADLYDPVTGQWTATGDMKFAVRGLTVTSLADGGALVAGGWHIGQGFPDVGEIFDAGTGTWSLTGKMIQRRYAPSATALGDGRILVAGGLIDGDHPAKSAETYDPATNRWQSGDVRFVGALVRLGDDRVLVMHGAAAPEIFDPGRGTWTTGAKPPIAGDQATLLRNGDALVLAGADGAELYDPSRDVWAQIGDPRTGTGRSVLLGDGSVLVVGGERSARFDPVTGTWSHVDRPPLPVDYALASKEGIQVDALVALADGARWRSKAEAPRSSTRMAAADGSCWRTVADRQALNLVRTSGPLRRAGRPSSSRGSPLQSGTWPTVSP